MSNSSEGKILLNILKSLPKRGIWMIRQEGAWGEKEKTYVVINKAAWQHISKAHGTQELKPEAKGLPGQSRHNILDIQHITDLNNYVLKSKYT